MIPQEINAYTELYGIFGNPVRHSRSPLMHNAAFGRLGINAVYLAFQPESIEDGVRAFRALGMKGASVTIPFKVEVMEFCDSISPLAQNIGAVNTLIHRNGGIEGDNTDGYGAVLALIESGAAVAGEQALVIGNGGSARAIAFTLHNEGCAVTIAGRNPDRFMPLVEELRKSGADVRGHLISGLTPEITGEYSIIINTTPVGMEPDTGSTPFRGELFHSSQTVFDIVYAPDVTMFLAEAGEKGCRIVKGSEMLLCQGIRQFELWTGMKAPADIMRAALKR